MVMCPRQQQNANLMQVEIENLIVRRKNLPRTNSTKSESQNSFAKKQKNEHTQNKIWRLHISLKKKKNLLSIFINYNNLEIINY